MMSVSLLLMVGVGVIVLSVIAGVAIIAVAKKSPGLALIVGLVLLLGFGGVLGSLTLVRTARHSTVFHDSHEHDLHGFPNLAHSPEWTSFDPHSSHGGTPIKGTWAITPMLFGAGIVAALVAMASIRKFNNSPPGPRKMWPAIMLIPVVAIVGLMLLGFFGLRITREFGGVPTFTPLPPPNFAQLQAEQAYEKARRAEEIGIAQVQFKVAEDEEQRRREVETAEQTRRAANAMVAQLTRQIASMDIESLITMFEAPKIELVEVESPSPPTPPAAPSPDDNAPAPETTDALAEDQPAIETIETAEAVVDRSEKDADDHSPTAHTAAAADNDKPLPEWASIEPGPYAPNSWREVIVTDEYATTDECRRATDILLMMKTADRVHSIGRGPFFESHLPSLTFNRSHVMADGNIIFDSRFPENANDDRLQFLNKMGIGVDHVRRSTLRGQHMASRESPRSMGTMYKQYTLVEFTPEFDNELRRAWDNFRRQERFEMVGAGAGSVLGLLGLVFGLLKIDTLTKGYYSKRLFIGVPGAIIGVLVLWSLI